MFSIWPMIWTKFKLKWWIKLAKLKSWNYFFTIFDVIKVKISLKILNKWRLNWNWMKSSDNISHNWNNNRKKMSILWLIITVNQHQTLFSRHQQVWKSYFQCFHIRVGLHFLFFSFDVCFKNIRFIIEFLSFPLSNFKSLSSVIGSRSMSKIV